MTTTTTTAIYLRYVYRSVCNFVIHNASVRTDTVQLIGWWFLSNTSLVRDIKDRL